MLNGDTNHRGNLARAAVLGLLGSRGPLSRAETARLLGISAATVTQVTKDLLARQLITELRSVPSAGGRPATLLGLVRSAGHALGVKVTADHVAVVSVELDGTVQDSQVAPFDPRSATALDELVAIIGRAADAHQGPLLGVGVGLPGSVDSPSSGVVDASTLGWIATPVGELLRRRTGLPVLVDNDVNTIATTEILYGVGRQHPSFLVVTIGRGIGCGIVLDGEVVRGGRGGAGEIGHIPVSDDGPRCECGNVGCLEAFAGEVGMLRQASELGIIADDATMGDLVGQAQSGNPAAAELFERAATLLGRTVAGLVHTIDPQVLVLTGEGVDAWELWRPGFEVALRRHLIPSRRTIPYLVEPWTEGQWAVGAASLVLAAPFDSAGTSGRQAELVRARLQGIPAEGSAR